MDDVSAESSSSDSEDSVNDDDSNGNKQTNGPTTDSTESNSDVERVHADVSFDAKENIAQISSGESHEKCTLDMNIIDRVKAGNDICPPTHRRRPGKRRQQDDRAGHVNVITVAPKSNSTRIMNHSSEHHKSSSYHPQVCNGKSMSYNSEMYELARMQKSPSAKKSSHLPRNGVYSVSNDEEPLDLSLKVERNHSKIFGDNASLLPAISSSLQTLQQKFGRNFPFENIKQRNPFISDRSFNKPPQHTPPKPTEINSAHVRKSSNSSPRNKESPSKTVSNNKTVSSILAKIAEAENEKGIPEKSSLNKYTMHRCSCKDSFQSLYQLSLHLQVSGHIPLDVKSHNMLDYPKLVRGQDMWLNQESEQTRRILRCIQCGDSFQTLPELTVHMMQTQHYTKIVSNDHGRRSHRCSSYCEKEMDKECIFKCKVCHSFFTDMEGLANHMILSGHHKKQASKLSPSPDDYLRSRRKRRFSGDSLVNLGVNPTVANLLDYKRKCITKPLSFEDKSGSETDSEAENFITCENCEHRIEMHKFVEHVRLCLHKTSNHLFDASKQKLLSEDASTDYRHKTVLSNCIKTECIKSRTTSDDQCHIKATSTENMNNDNSKESDKGKSDDRLKNLEEDNVEMKVNVKLEQDDEHCLSESPLESLNKFARNISFGKFSRTELFPQCSSNRDCSRDDRLVNRLQPDKLDSVLEKSRQDSVDPKSPRSLRDSGDQHLPRHHLDIIDPNSSEEYNNSALKAMESFIQNSFTSRLSSRRNQIKLPSKAEHFLPMEHSHHFSQYHRIKYKKFYKSLCSQNGKSCPESYDENKSVSSAKSPVLENKNKSVIVSPLPFVKSEQSINKADSPRPSTPSSGTDVHEKYLDPGEETDDGGSTSALNSLSSFVYGQILTSEHPLDSLQKLNKNAIIHYPFTTSPTPPPIPPSHLPDDCIPLNLSIKCHRIDTIEAVDKERSENGGSPNSIDDENVEYKCHACSRLFASKGSYRYHLSRCHLSSVKKYGIKEAFNMSPYVYLPLDHTARFSKYYKMANELANKGK